jgi:tetratricopeptide (TPR) repeat protein
MRSDEFPQQHMAFFQQAEGNAIAYRLSMAQKEAGNYDRLERKLPNLWEAVRQTYRLQAWTALLAFREALQPVLDLRGYWKQSILLNEWACEGAYALGDRLNAIRWTHDRADMQHQQGNYAEAARVYQNCEEAYRAIGEQALALKSRHMRCLVLRAQGRSLEARQLCETTLRETSQLGLTAWMAHPLYVKGLLLRDLGAILQVERCIEQSLALLTTQPPTTEEAMIAQCYHFLGETALRRGNPEQARERLLTSLHLSQQVGITRRVAATQRALGNLERSESHFEEAERLYSEAFNSVTRLGDRPELAKLQLARAQMLMQQHETKEAILGLRAARVLFQEMGDARGMMGSALLCAQCALRQLHLVEATRSLLAMLRIAVAFGQLRWSNLRRFLRWWRLRAGG